MVTDWQGLFSHCWPEGGRCGQREIEHMGNGLPDARRRGLLQSVLGTLSSVKFAVGLALILHGYVGFIFGSIKTNPRWGNILVPSTFISRLLCRASPCAYFCIWLSIGRP
jgi:hypothetical protein